MNSRVFQSYYTKSSYITDYMISSLCINGSEIIFEPCAGDGVFIDEIIKDFPNIEIDAFELNSTAYNVLVQKYKNNSKIRIKHTDTLLDQDLDLICEFGGKYDAIIANPPYGAWRDIESRKNIKNIFDGLYSKESYSLFLYRCIKALKDGGRLSFIIPDTYLHLNRHKEIRKYLLESTRIKEISLFPSSFFPGVNFGYANLSIITTEKHNNKSDCLANNIIIKKGYGSVDMLPSDKCSNVDNLLQSDILNNSDYAFINNSDPNVVKCIKSTKMTIGDICDCVTGFYSGNDKDYLRVRNKEVRNAKRYDVVDQDSVEYNFDNISVFGLPQKKSYIPIVKGGNTKYYKENNWFMLWTSDMVQFYKKDKKARFQNSSFYFKNGIGVPMISSSSVTASLLDYRLFDQSIVGIFPKDNNLLFYLLAFFNSPTCNKLIRAINPSTNNSSNYLKKIPLLLPTENDIIEISNNIHNIINCCKANLGIDIKVEDANNEIIKSVYGF